MVVFQYPIYSKILTRKIIYEIKNQRARCYLIIHDLESLRIFKNRPRFQKYEVSLINNVDGVIVHNDRMKEKL